MSLRIAKRRNGATFNFEGGVGGKSGVSQEK